MVPTLPLLLFLEAEVASVLTWNSSESTLLEKGGAPKFRCFKFCCRQSDIAMHSFCLLTLMELIVRPNCSLLYLHSNGMNCLVVFVVAQLL